MNYRMIETIRADGQKSYAIQERAWWSPFWSDMTYGGFETPEKAREQLVARLGSRVVRVNVSHVET